MLSDARAREFTHRGSAVRTAGGRSRSAFHVCWQILSPRRSVKRNATRTGRACGIKRTGTDRRAKANSVYPMPTTRPRRSCSDGGFGQTSEGLEESAGLCGEEADACENFIRHSWMNSVNCTAR